MSTESAALLIIGSLLAVLIFYFFGLYNSTTRFIGPEVFKTLVLSFSVYTILWTLFIAALDIISIPFDFLFINYLLSIVLVGGSRTFIRWLYKNYSSTSRKAIIYGAGSGGLQLASALQYSPEIKAIAFIDDDETLQGKRLNSLKVYPYSSLEELMTKNNVREILIAIPSLSKSQIGLILNKLKKFSITIRVLPGVDELAQGKVEISELKNIKIEDILQRETVPPNINLLEKNIKSKAVMVTGAGGSIGSQLCREITNHKPKLLVIYEINEYSLYKIEKELYELSEDFNVFPILGNVEDSKRFSEVCLNFSIQTIYHTAAYKHVPLVEMNPIEGVKNNIFGTLNPIKIAIENDIETFVFVSSDKAVRPTSIMGASKRFAELILQSFADTDPKTRIGIVRFGNVIGSSGSVVPLFYEQIQAGGPITVTDPNIVRYFMTQEEAAQLVIQAGSLGERGEIFLLDMGDPVKIVDLARQMIHLSGYTIRDSANPDGDIEIIFSGLRPGEKLYEELLIENKSSNTSHPKIMKAEEVVVSWGDIEQYLDQLNDAIKNRDQELIRKTLLESVSGYNPQCDIADILYQYEK